MVEDKNYPGAINYRERLGEDDPLPAKRVEDEALPQLRPLSMREGVQLLPVAVQEKGLTEWKTRHDFFKQWLLSQFILGVHYGFPPGCEARYDDQGNLMVKSQGGYTPYPTTQWKPKPMIYNTGLKLAQDIFNFRAEFESAELGGAGASKGILRLCVLYDAQNRIGSGHGIAEWGQKGRDMNSSLKMADVHALRAAVLNTFPILAELFDTDYRGEIGGGTADTTTADDDTPATRAAKEILRAEVKAYIASKNCPQALDANALIMAVVNNELQKATIDTVRDLQAVKAAILAGDYELETGQKIPPANQ
jgi:hypothetical protein